MSNTTIDSGLGEAVSSYQPKVLTEAQWARFRDDAIAMVLQMRHSSSHRAIQRLSHLCLFLADVADGEPDASLAELLSRDRVDGYLDRADGQVAASTLQNRQAALNNFLKVSAGAALAQPSRRKTEPHLEPYSEAELIRLLAAASSDPSTAGAAFARTIGCVLAGVGLPADGEQVEVAVTGGCIEVEGRVWTAPVGLPMPAGGTVTRPEVDRGRRWARTTLEVAVDLRRLELSAMTQLAGSASAVELLARPDLGRDRLTVVMRAAVRPDEATVKGWLRGG